MKSIALLAAATALITAPAAAQTVEPAAVPAPPPVITTVPPVPVVMPVAVAAPVPVCELHVWPAERFQAMTSGWGAAFGALGALADSAGHASGDKARRSHLASALDSEGQLTALQQLDLVSLLHLKPSQIVVHGEALDRKTINKIPTRRAQSSSPCYSELIVADVMYQKAALYGRSLKTLFMLREFGSAASKPAIYKTWGGNGLKLFPPKPGEDVSAADAELVSIFQRNFEEAARNFDAKRKTKS